jgi:hypothetical protein
LKKQNEQKKKADALKKVQLAELEEQLNQHFVVDDIENEEEVMLH